MLENSEKFSDLFGLFGRSLLSLQKELRQEERGKEATAYCSSSQDIYKGIDNAAQALHWGQCGMPRMLCPKGGVGLRRLLCAGSKGV